MIGTVWKKGFVLAIIVLLLGVAMVPSTGSHLVTTQSTNNVANVTREAETVEITIRDYHGDDTFTEVKHPISLQDAKTLWETLKTTNESTKKLALLKQYGLVSPGTSLQTYEQNMHQMRRDLGLPREIVPGKDVKMRPWLFNLFSNVSVMIAGFPTPTPIINLALGASSIAGLINYYFDKEITSIDLLATSLIWTLAWGEVITEGLLGEKTADMFLIGSSTLVGFFGTCVYIPLGLMKIQWGNMPYMHFYLPITGVIYMGSALAVAAFPARCYSYD